MNLSPQQDKALTSVSDWLKGKEQVFRLFGYAGTGKTTIAKRLAEDVSGPVLFGAYTGKAALVLKRAGCSNARTIHSLMYQSRDKGQTRLKEMETQLALAIKEKADEAILERLRRMVREERTSLSKPAFSINLESDIRHCSLIVIDECSMIDEQMGNDLVSFGKKILVLGDPAQLPPVRGGGYFTAQKPDVMLTEIHRQAKDNPIINLATTVREGGYLNLGKYGESSVIERSACTPELMLAASQLLVGKNATRHASNKRFRTLLGRDESQFPVEGDKLVCLRNDREKGLLNGSLWLTKACVQTDVDRLSLSVDSEDGDGSVDCEAHTAHFLGKTEEMTWWERKDAQEFDYGYALTVHKSQGSQWENVVVFDEWNRGDRKEWLYTAITRAQEKITVVKM